MTVEIRAVWIDGVRYAIEEARVLAKDLDAILASLDTSDKTFPVRPTGGIFSSPPCATEDPEYKREIALAKAAGVILNDPRPNHSRDNPRTHLCSTCGEEGHNKQTCKKADRSRTYRCSNCGDAGHNRRTCEWVA